MKNFKEFIIDYKEAVCFFVFLILGISLLITGKVLRGKYGLKGYYLAMQPYCYDCSVINEKSLRETGHIEISDGLSPMDVFYNTDEIKIKDKGYCSECGDTEYALKRKNNCLKCGKSYREGAKYCTNCGSDISVNSQYVKVNDSGVTMKQVRRISWLYFIGVCLIFLAFILVFILLFIL